MGIRARRYAKGFTLLEALLSVTIGAALIGSAYMVYQTGQSTVASGQRGADLQQNARAALDMLTWQIRLAGYLNQATTKNWIAIGTDNLLVVRGNVQLNCEMPGDTCAPPVALSDTLFAFQNTGTGVCPAPAPNYPASSCLVTGTSVYTANAAPTIMAYNIWPGPQSITFAYFDQNNVQLVTPLDGVNAGAYNAVPSDPLPGTTTSRNSVRKIRITLTALDPLVNANTGTGTEVKQFVLTSDVRVRETD